MHARGLVAILTLTAALVVVPAGASADLLFNGTIEGQVTLWGTGEPVEGAVVWGIYDYGFAADTTDADGYYRLENLEAGDYSVAFLRDGPSDPFVYFEEVLTITNDEVYSGIDGMVQDEGTMIGRVSDDTTGLPVAGICADVHDLSDTVVGTAVSNADGWLLYPDVTVGYDDRWLESSARIYDCNDLGYADEWYFGIVEYLSLRGRFDARIGAPAAIAGTVTGSGLPLDSVCVSLRRSQLDLGTVTTDSSGYYEFTDLIASDLYQLDFEDCSDPVGYRSVLGVAVTATSGTTTYHDQSLDPIASVSGVVTDASTGLPLEGICVLGTAEWFQGSRFAIDTTDASGAYSLAVPAAAEHQYVRAYWCGETPRPYEEQWWDGVPTFEEATDLEIGPLEHRFGVDLALPKMASLQGTLTGVDGKPAETYISFEPLFEGATWTPWGRSNPDGTYRVDNIEAGEYLIRFGSDGVGSTYVPEWHDDVPDPADATAVVFEWGEVVTIDAELEQMGAIKWDFVVDWDAYPTMCAYLTDSDGRTVAEMSDRAERPFATGRLPAGDYLLYAEDCNIADPDVAAVWYPDAATRDDAEVLTVAGDLTDLGDWFLSGDIPGPSSLTGSITNDGTPFDVCVTVFDQDMAVLADTMAVSGEYSVDGLVLHGPEAALYVQAEDCDDPAVSAWYGGATQEDAVQIPFGLGIDWVGVDVEFVTAVEFVDIGDSVFAADIVWLAGAGITRGCNPPLNTEYCPEQTVTREQMAAFLVRALGLTERLDDPFTDDDGSVFEADIERLAAAGITRGCNPPVNDQFCPSAPVTREQMAAFLVRALGYTDPGDGDLFADDDESVFESAIDRLAIAGVTRGCNPPVNDRFCPGVVVTRGQMAAFLHRALG